MWNLPLFVFTVVLAIGIGWIIGEATDKPWLRRVCGPLFALSLAAIATILTGIHTSFDSSLRFSGTTKRFVSALIAAIDEGEIEKAHRELRRFDRLSGETYEGGAFVRSLNEATERLMLKVDTEAETNDDFQH